MAVQTKICGVTSAEAVAACVAQGADFIGFVFYPPSVRSVSPEDAAVLANHIPPNINKVAVTVDADDRLLDAIMEQLKPEIIQCHGQETKERVADIKRKYSVGVIKAVPVQSSDDIAYGKAYRNVADMLLFDAKVPTSTLPGGNGLAFDWQLLKDHQPSVPWFLSGGLGIANVAEAVRVTGATMVDVSSSLESKAGVKDVDLIKEFLAITRTL